MATKTVEEIDALKLNWIKDPCWDIEETEGFEEHKDELLTFRQKIEKEAHARVHRMNEEKKEWIGDHDPLDLIKSITLPFEIESTLAALDHQVGDCGSAVAYANFEISRAQVRTNLLIAIQLKRIAQILEDKHEEDSTDISIRSMTDLYNIKK
jgi:hypothetical protein